MPRKSYKPEEIVAKLRGEYPALPRDIGPDAGQVDPAGGSPGKLLSPARRRACIEHVRGVLVISERRACEALGQHRSTQRKIPRGRTDEALLTADIVNWSDSTAATAIARSLPCCAKPVG